MERLTYDFALGGNHCWQVKGADNLECREVCQCQEDKGCKDCPIAKAFDRLAAYEDTGLEPEGVEAMKNAMMGKSIAEITEFEGIPIERLRKLAQADREGRCVVLPCGPRQVVWAANSFGVSSHQIRMLVRDKDGDFACSMIKFPLEDFGRKVFLTREEAQAALRREQA